MHELQFASMLLTILDFGYCFFKEKLSTFSKTYMIPFLNSYIRFYHFCPFYSNIVTMWIYYNRNFRGASCSQGGVKNFQDPWVARLYKYELARRGNLQSRGWPRPWQYWYCHTEIQSVSSVNQGNRVRQGRLFSPFTMAEPRCYLSRCLDLLPKNFYTLHCYNFHCFFVLSLACPADAVLISQRYHLVWQPTCFHRSPKSRHSSCGANHWRL